MRKATYLQVRTHDALDSNANGEFRPDLFLVYDFNPVLHNGRVARSVVRHNAEESQGESSSRSYSRVMLLLSNRFHFGHPGTDTVNGMTILQSSISGASA